MGMKVSAAARGVKTDSAPIIPRPLVKARVF
jgi:hypothetical protein